MASYLKVQFPQKCIGCELCIFEIQRQMNKAGLEGSLIRVLKSPKENSRFLEYSIQLDPLVYKFDIEQIKEICPTDVFEIVKEQQDELAAE